MPYRIAGIDVHKKILAVVVSDVEVDGEFHFERRWFGSNPEQLRSLAAWLVEQEAEEVVMESTAQYWKPIWGALERYWKPAREKRVGSRRRSGTLHLAQALSNRGRRGRKRDFRDAEEWSANCEAWAIRSKRPILNPARHNHSDFRACAHSLATTGKAQPRMAVPLQTEPTVIRYGAPRVCVGRSGIRVPRLVRSILGLARLQN